jgi:hypothetical protein
MAHDYRTLFTHLEEDMDRTADDVGTDADDNTESLKTLVTKAEFKLAQETYDLALKRRIVDAMPPRLALKAATLHASGYKCEASMKFVMTERKQALVLLEQLPPVDVVLLRESCTSLIPKERFDGVLKPSQRVEDIAPVHFNVEGYGGGHVSEEYVWWTRVADLLLQVRVSLERTCAGGVFIRALHQRFEEGAPYHWQFDNVPAGLGIDWWGATYANAGRTTVYWLPTDDYKDKLLTTTTRTRKGSR